MSKFFIIAHKICFRARIDELKTGATEDEHYIHMYISNQRISNYPIIIKI